MSIFILTYLSLTLIQKKPSIILLYKIREEIFRSRIFVCVNCMRTQAYSKEGNQWTPSENKKKNPFFFLQEKDSWYLENCIQFGLPSKSEMSINWSEFDRGTLVWSGNSSTCIVKRDWGYCSCSAWEKKKLFGGSRETWQQPGSIYEEVIRKGRLFTVLHDKRVRDNRLEMKWEFQTGYKGKLFHREGCPSLVAQRGFPISILGNFQRLTLS